MSVINMALEKHDAYVIFATVGDVESISGAARMLNLPKATVSRAVSNLEAHYGVKLIERTARKSLLTEVGRILHNRCCRMREEISDAGSEIASYRGDAAGTLRIGCSSSIARAILTPNIHEFLKMYPDIDLRVHVGERLLPEPTAFDVVFHSGWLSDSRLVARKISDVDIILVASHDYISQRGMPQSAEDLSRHDVIGNFYPEGHSIRPGHLPAYVPKAELTLNGETYAVPFWKRFSSTDQYQVLEVVKNGLAIAPVASIAVVEELLSGDLVHVLRDYKVSHLPSLYAIYTDRLSMVPKLKLFLDFIEECVSSKMESAKSRIV